MTHLHWFCRWLWVKSKAELPNRRDRKWTEDINSYCIDKSPHVNIADFFSLILQIYRARVHPIRLWKSLTCCFRLTSSTVSGDGCAYRGDARRGLQHTSVSDTVTHEPTSASPLESSWCLLDKAVKTLSWVLFVCLRCIHSIWGN